MALYDQLESHFDGDPRTADHVVNAWLYPNQTGSNGNDDYVARNAVNDGMSRAFSRLLNYGAIDGYQIKVYKYSTGINISGSDTWERENSYFDPFDNWLISDNPHNQNLKGRKGVHIGVTNEIDFASIESFSFPDETAFDEGVTGYVGTKGSEGKYMNFAAQEPLHGFIYPENSTVFEYTLVDEEERWMHDHDLGQIYASRYSEGPVSPMATLYEGSDDHPNDVEMHAYHDDDDGCAENNYWDGTYSQTPTHCTIDAVATTAENSGGT